MQKEISTLKLNFQTEIASDKTLTNETKRKAALAERLDSNPVYAEFESHLETLKNEAALLSIDLRYNRDLIDLNIACIKQP